MFRFSQHRLGHYALLLATTAALTLPNLGKFSLFDIDEGVNAEAAREMLESGNWIVPTFNFELRTAKPVFLYWLQSTSYALFGVNEFAARLPSVLAAMLTVLLTYELGRSMYRPSTGLLAGLVLSSAFYFCLIAHAATPDSTLLLFTVLTLYLFWQGSADGGRWWFVPAGMASGLAVLTKGPVGLALPGATIFTFLLWNRQLGRLWDRRLIWGILAFLAVALPWYILVTVETRGAWASAFFGKENLQRFASPMENHRGPIFFHVVGLLIFFAPWSIFFAISLWRGWRESQTPLTVENGERGRNAGRFLLCWFGIYLVFFSVAATKLPNYVLPLYPALAVLTARFLDGWRMAEFAIPKWVLPTAWVGLATVGLATLFGLLVVGGALPIPGLKMHLFPGIERWAFLGTVPLIALAVILWQMRRQRRTAVVATLVAASAMFVGSMAAFAVDSFDRFKAPRELVANADAAQPAEEVKLGSLFYFQPSLVFYSQREVKKFDSFEQTADFLSLPYRVFVFVPEPVWRELAPRATVAYRLAARHFDFLKNCDILVLTNR